jgi:hypothetical protein
MGVLVSSGANAAGIASLTPTLPNAAPLTPEERVSINEFLVPLQMVYSLFLKMADEGT